MHPFISQDKVLAACKKHGMAAAEGAHAGDMPNLHVPASGELTVEIANPAISLVKGQPTNRERAA